MQVADKHRDVRSTAVLAVVCAFLQLAIAPNLTLANGAANFALVFAACVALTQGGGSSVVAGFVAGLLFDLTTTGPVGLMAFCLTVCAYALGLEGRNRMAGEFASSLLTFVVAAFGVSLVYGLAMLLVGEASSLLDVLVYRTLPTTLLTSIGFVPFALVLSRVRVGGSGSSLGSGGLGSGASLGKGKGSGLGGKHLTTRGL